MTEEERNDWLNLFLLVAILYKDYIDKPGGVEKLLEEMRGPECNKLCRFYEEVQDMGANIPFCKLIRGSDPLQPETCISCIYNRRWGECET